jgi:hypothetical protein
MSCAVFSGVKTPDVRARSEACSQSIDSATQHVNGCITREPPPVLMLPSLNPLLSLAHGGADH